MRTAIQVLEGLLAKQRLLACSTTNNPEAVTRSQTLENAINALKGEGHPAAHDQLGWIHEYVPSYPAQRIDLEIMREIAISYETHVNDALQSMDRADACRIRFQRLDQDPSVSLNNESRVEAKANWAKLKAKQGE